MLKIIGNTGCSRCTMVKTLLTSKGIDFDYSLLDDLSEKNKERYIKQAEEKGMMNMPLIIKDDEIVDLKEVM